MCVRGSASLRDCREIEYPLGKMDCKDMRSAAVAEGFLHLTAGLQRNSVNGHPSSQYCLSVGEVEEARRLVARAREHAPPLPPVLLAHKHTLCEDLHYTPSYYYLDPPSVQRRRFHQISFLHRAGVNRPVLVHPPMRHNPHYYLLQPMPEQH